MPMRYVTCYGDLMLLHHLSGVVQVLQVLLDESELVLVRVHVGLSHAEIKNDELIELSKSKSK